MGCLMKAGGWNVRIAALLGAFAAGCLVTWGMGIGERPGPEPPHSWTLGESSFGPWIFLASRDEVRDPRTYSPLPYFSPNCCGKQPTPGVLMWGSAGGLPPDIGINTTGETQHFFGTLTWPAGSVYMHPGQNRMVVAGWRSPIAGTVGIRGQFVDLDPVCGNGINWFIDHNATSLARGSFENGGHQAFVAGTNGSSLAAVEVAQGDLLFFVVDAKNGDYLCDSTELDATIVSLR